MGTFITENGSLVTIGFIVLSAVVAAFFKRRSRDKCLKDFSDDLVNLQETDGKFTFGKLDLEHTGLELIYATAQKNEKGFDQSSSIFYKHEYSKIQALVRFHDDLTEEGKALRQKELGRTYHPNLLRRSKRRLSNIFKTLRDSVMEVINMLISHARKVSPTGAATLSSQDKYVKQIKQEMMTAVGTSYEPLLEKHIGHKVVLELIESDKICKYSGVLKDYTAEFIEIMDVNYSVKEDRPPRTADIVVPRKYGIVRHLGEQLL